MGNRTSYNGNTYTWVGRELKSVENGSSISYRYNAEGIRTKKTVDGVTTKYFLNGSQILAETKDGSTIWYFYDSEGLRVGLICGGKIYYYMYNLQGDVVGLARASDGKIAATYKYDAWGKCTVNNIENEDVGTKNPFRYKGYYYDRETGLYYLNSRYYSPAFGRFINADTTDVLGVSGDLYDKNLYAYCDNNPIMRKDAGGQIWVTAGIMVAGGGIGASISAVGSVISQYADTGTVNVKSVLVAAGSGFVSGALAASPWGKPIQVIGNVAINVASYAVDCLATNKDIDGCGLLISFGTGLFSGVIGGDGANKDYILTNAIKYSKKVIRDMAKRNNVAYANKRLVAIRSQRNDMLSSTFWRGSAGFSVGVLVTNGVMITKDRFTSFAK